MLTFRFGGAITFGRVIEKQLAEIESKASLIIIHKINIITLFI